jgi:hypothetical protein
MDLASNEMINSTSFQVEGQQDRFTAVSTECEAQIEQDIDY